MKTIFFSSLAVLLTLGCQEGTGEKGADGSAGEAGAAGADGEAGAAGADGEDGAAGADGEDGAAGADGEDGAAGADGEDGAAGTDGADSEDGEDGAAGADGADGAAGEDGEDGEDGAAGTDGEDGEDGEGGEAGEDGACYGVDALAFYGSGITADGEVRTDAAQGFTANLNDTGLDVELAFVGLETYEYAGGDTFSATFAEVGVSSFTIIATDGCSIAMDTVSVEVVSGLDFVGSFIVETGPAWSTIPPTYSCLEACALIFGGSAVDYACSTVSDEISHTAYYYGYAIEPGCDETDIRGEDDKVGSTYDEAGAYSAYVDDFSCGHRNYCFM